MFVSHGNIFCNGNKNATSLYETAFLIGVSIFSVNRKRIVLLTLFCLLKNRNNGNFTVPIHKIPVMALLIIRIINFRFRFKCGTDRNEYRERCDDSVFGYGEGRGSHGRQSAAFAGREGASPLQTVGGRVRFLGQSG